MTEAMDIGEFVGTAAARGRIAVLLGTEGHGLTAEALARADVRLRIPMTRRAGFAEHRDCGRYRAAPAARSARFC